MDAVNALNILNTLNLEHGGALNGCCESSKHSEHSEFGTWWCFQWMLNEHSKCGTWWCEWTL